MESIWRNGWACAWTRRVAISTLLRAATSSRTVAALLCAAVVLIGTACSRPFSSSGSNSGSQAVTCSDVAASVIQRERVGDTAGAINSEIQWLSDNCSEEYDIAIDYISNAGLAKGQFGAESCDFLLSRNIHPESVRLLQVDGLCTGSGSTVDAPSSSQWPNGGLSWDQAVNYVGTSQRICGPLMSMRISDDDVFLNIGRDYPDSQRFVVVVWDIGGVKAESPGVTICASGTVTFYNGVAQIELRDLGPIEIWD